MPSRTKHEGLLLELRREGLASLARATERLEAALRELAAADVALKKGGDTPKLRALRAEALAQAAERLWYVIIQREVMGLTRHDLLDEIYEIPREVHLAMGTRRGRG